MEAKTGKIPIGDAIVENIVKKYAPSDRVSARMRYRVLTGGDAV